MDRVMNCVMDWAVDQVVDCWQARPHRGSTACRLPPRMLAQAVRAQVVANFAANHGLDDGAYRARNGVEAMSSRRPIFTPRGSMRDSSPSYYLLKAATSGRCQTASICRLAAAHDRRTFHPTDSMFAPGGVRSLWARHPHPGE